MQAFLLKLGDGLIGELVLTQRTHGNGVQPKLAGMIGEIGWGAAQFSTIGKHVPQCFAQSHYIFIFHDVMIFSYIS